MIMDYPDLGQDAYDGLKTSTFVKTHTYRQHMYLIHGYRLAHACTMLCDDHITYLSSPLIVMDLL